MDNLTGALDAVTAALADTVACGELRVLSDGPLLAAVVAIERLGRRIDALRVEAAGEVAERSRVEHGSASLAMRKGCRNPVELIQRVTLVSGATAARRIRLGYETRTQLSLSGVEFPARFPQVAAALASGALGVDAAASILKGLMPTLDRVAIDDLAAAEAALVASAIGQSVDSAVACTSDELRIQALVWQAVLDPDGLEPTEERSLARRHVRMGRENGGLVNGTFALLPEVAGKFQRLCDAYMSPKTAPAFMSDAEFAESEAERDPRTPDQQRHDILAAMIDAMARSGQTPTIGGAAPTVLVSVRQDDLERGRGAGYVDGVETPISMRAVRQFACTGGIQTVRLDRVGRIIELGSPRRCFTPQQRRAITLRDGGCLIPGCKVPAAWCEIHHVVPDTDGGPTHPDNGVLLCWFHHRSIETSGWGIRMKNGAPHIKAPPWLELDGRWRPATKSRTRLSDTLQRMP
ncbi:MAG: HNH endonuclease signature motif containing protein [Lacisediminihabitans sp.]